MFRFLGGAGGAHAGGGPILRLIIVDDVDPDVLVLLLELKTVRPSPKSPYNCFGMSSGGLYS